MRPCVTWLASIGLGFCYVSSVLCERSHPLKSGNNVGVDFLIIMLACGLLYFVGPIHNIPTLLTLNRPQSAIRSFSIVAAFIAALHWDYVGQVLNVSFSITPHQIASLDLRSGVILLIATALLLLLCGFHIYQAKKQNILRTYALSFAAIVSVVALITSLVSERYYIHVHHYCLGLLLFPFCRFQNVLSISSQGFLLGLAIEGIARWGMDPLWYAIK